MATTKIRSSSILDGQVANADLSATVAVTGGQIADDAVTLAKMAGLVRGKIIVGDASGDPSALTVGASTQVLTSDGTDAAWAAAAAGGLTTASQWRLTADFNGGLQPIAANLEQVDAPAGFGVLGSSMTESSGVFTFPSTGYWVIRFNPFWYTASYALTFIYGKIVTTDDDSTWVEAARAGQMNPTTDAGYLSCSLEYIFDVVSTSTHKVQFWVNTSGAGADTLGDSGYNETHMTFLRLADRP